MSRSAYRPEPNSRIAEIRQPAPRRGALRLTLIVLVGLVIPLGILKFAPELFFEYFWQKRDQAREEMQQAMENAMYSHFDPDQRESVRMKKGQVYLLRTDNAQALIEFTRFGKERANYRWRYKADNEARERSDTGEVFEKYESIETAPNTFTVKDLGSQLHIKAGTIDLEWSYSGTNSGWVYYDASKVKLKLLQDGVFAAYDLSTPYQGSLNVAAEIEEARTIRSRTEVEPGVEVVTKRISRPQGPPKTVEVRQAIPLEKRVAKLRAWVKKTDFLQNTLLLVAIEKGDMEVAAHALDQPETDVNAKDSYGLNALMKMALRMQPDNAEHVALFKRLIETTANLDDTNKVGFTALARAVHRGKTAAVEMLLQGGASVTAENPKTGSPSISGAMLSGARKAGADAPKLLRLLREAGCRPGAVENPMGDDTSVCRLN